MLGLKPRRPSKITPTELHCVLFNVNLLAKYEVILFEIQGKKKKKKDAAPFQPPFHIKVGDGVGSEIGGLSSVKLTHIIDFESHKE